MDMPEIHGSSTHFMAKLPRTPGSRRRSAFTLIELLVVVAIIAILASLLIPALAKAKERSKRINCLNNQRQLMLAIAMYAIDNDDRVPYAAVWPRNTNSPVWVQGELDFNPKNPSNWNVTYDILISPLFRYCGESTAIWRCPADRSTVTVDGRPMPRVRTLAMNGWVGGEVNQAPPEIAGPWRVFRKLSDMTVPGPSETWVLIDQREDAINPTAEFSLDMTGFPGSTASQQFFDYPAMHHNLGAILSFGDGHAEYHHWRDPRTTPALMPPPKGFAPPGWPPIASPGNPDLSWLQAHSTSHL